MNNENLLLEGIISIQAAINSKKREIVTIFVDKNKVEKNDRKIIRFLSFLSANSYKPEICERELIDSYANSVGADLGSTNGGVIAVCKDRTYMEINELLKKVRNENGYAVFLDGIEDPFNFGYSIRNLYAAGASGIIIPKRNWLSAANVCARASAGASELIDIAIMPYETDEEFARFLKQKAISIVCAAKNKYSISYCDFETKGPFVLVIGGEKRGISKEYMEYADEVIHIPYCNDSVRYSLPTASVAAILGFQLQQKFEKK